MLWPGRTARPPVERGNEEQERLLLPVSLRL